MVNIDTVYQKVLTFANKEQRGYITPQEFNLFADQAQKEIFEQYFYDLNQFSRAPGNSEEYSDIIHNINEKIAIFEKVADVQNNVTTLSAADLYRLGTVMSSVQIGSSYSGSESSTTAEVEVEEVQQNEILYLNLSYLTRPTENRPVYVRTGKNKIQIYPATITSAKYTYVSTPTKPAWNYVVVNNKAMFNPSGKVDFELHPSEENELVYKILKFAGLAMKRDDIARGGQGLESLQIQQEKQ